MLKNQFLLVTALLVIGFCGGCKKSDDSSKDPVISPSAVELTDKSFGGWSEALWNDFRNYRNQETAILRDWTETSKKENDLVDFVQSDTDVGFMSEDRKQLDFVAIGYDYRSNGVFQLTLVRAKKDFYPEVDCIECHDNDADGKFDKVTIFETLDQNTKRNVATVDRNTESEEEFKKLDVLLTSIKQDSNYESRKKRWEGMWAK